MRHEPDTVHIGSYKSYLLYKRTIDRIRESPCTRKQIAKALGIDITNTWGVMRALVSNGVIERVSFELTCGGKRSVYGLIKDE